MHYSFRMLETTLLLVLLVFWFHLLHCLGLLVSTLGTQKKSMLVPCKLAFWFGALVQFEVNLSIISSYRELVQFTELWCAWSSFLLKKMKLKPSLQVCTRCVPTFDWNLRVLLVFWTTWLHLYGVLYHETRLNVSEEKALSCK